MPYCMPYARRIKYLHLPSRSSVVHANTMLRAFSVSSEPEVSNGYVEMFLECSYMYANSNQDVLICHFPS